MAINRRKVLKSRLLRALVKGGMDKRQMVRQLCKAPYLNQTTQVVGAFVWSGTPQGHAYWRGIETQIGQGW